MGCAQTNTLSTNTDKAYELLSKEDASRLILKDDVEHFFDKLSRLEMDIQMKDTQKLSYDERKALFLPFIASETMDFDSTEAVMISSVMDSAILLVNRLNPKLLSSTIQLVKINTNHYGPSVYYTRENGIYIPKDALAKGNTDELLAVMLHEISHIISRSDPAMKHQLYDQIGFKPLDTEVVYPKVVKDRILINPDGVNDDFYIPVKDKKTNEEYRVIPIITSDKDSYRLTSPAFFDYLKFDLYAIDDSGKVLATENGSSTLKMNEVEGFFEEIEDNTGYIIHPDEVIADNFMLLILAIEKNEYENFSPEGMILLNDIKQVLTSYKQ